VVPLRCRLPQTATGIGMQGIDPDTSRKRVRLRIRRAEVQILTGAPSQTLIPQAFAGFSFCEAPPIGLTIPTNVRYEMRPYFGQASGSRHGSRDGRLPRLLEKWRIRGPSSGHHGPDFRIPSAYLTEAIRNVKNISSPVRTVGDFLWITHRKEPIHGTDSLPVLCDGRNYSL
jgi:hypothetical protein